MMALPITKDVYAVFLPNKPFPALRTAFLFKLWHTNLMDKYNANTNDSLIIPTLNNKYTNMTIPLIFSLVSAP